MKLLDKSLQEHLEVYTGWSRKSYPLVQDKYLLNLMSKALKFSASNFYAIIIPHLNFN